jgi:hypothetical protein
MSGGTSETTVVMASVLESGEGASGLRSPGRSPVGREQRGAGCNRLSVYGIPTDCRHRARAPIEQEPSRRSGTGAVLGVSLESLGTEGDGHRAVS